MLSKDEQATNYATISHIHRVAELLHQCIKEMLDRANNHDKSKLEPPEVEFFTKFTKRLAGVTYGSDEYKALLVELKPALDHHYANNSHHPEFYKDGINDMNLLDLIEMLCDWKAASERHNDGNIRKSIEINGNRFGMSPQLIKIFENTVNILNYK